MITADKVMSEPQLNKFLKNLRGEKDKSLMAIQKSTKRNPKEVRIIMDFYLFALLAHTGLRISEALNLRWPDIHEDFLIVRAEISKNKKRGTVYFGPKTRALLDNFQSLRSGLLRRTETDLLYSYNGKIPSRSYAHGRFKYWIAQSGLPTELSIHSLRHTYGTICLDNGLSLTFVRDNLRHSNISITSQYLHLTKASRDKIKDLF
jgi:site-specific recombinase XerD